MSISLARNIVFTKNENDMGYFYSKRASTAWVLREPKVFNPLRVGKEGQKPPKKGSKTPPFGTPPKPPKTPKNPLFGPPPRPEIHT